MRFGLIQAVGLQPGRYPSGLDAAIEEVVAARAGDLSGPEEAVRLAARDMLRHGRYKPTGRGKPASEYLLRAAREGEFPRISPPVDICNLVSLEYLVPASIWDADLAGLQTGLLARRGAPEESYVFNQAGQAIDLEDLLLVAVDGRPIVNPVKDCHATKTHAETRSVSAVVYFPAAAILDAEGACDRFASLLRACGAEEAAWMIHSGRP